MDADAVIAAIAATQHGVVTRDQLVRAGVPVHRIEFRVKRGRLGRLFRGVYRVGPVSAARSSEMAAVLACGETAVLSHWSAADVWHLVPPCPREAVYVSAGPGSRRPGPGVRVYRTICLRPDDVVRSDGIPVTTPARTLMDIAARLSDVELERTVAHAWRERLATSRQLNDLLERHARQPGTRRLRALLATNNVALTRSEAEARFLGLVRKGQLQKPQVNVRILGFEVDFMWHSERVVVEIDGLAFHSARHELENDHRRDAVLLTNGFRVMRVTWRQLIREPEAVLVRLAMMLTQTGGTG